ncbi:MAG: hypothetical protein K2G01_01595, partial [Paramuribaculum sp.]|nr:hypothetical protein [Paramuribaculum sp.]
AVNPQLQRHKFGAKELLTEFGLAEYEMGIRRLNVAQASFSQIDPYAGRTPHFSSYSYCGGDPINYSDPTGLFRTREEAESYFSLNYSKFNVLYDDPIHYDQIEHEWYIALNEEKTEPYQTGATVFKLFNPLYSFTVKDNPVSIITSAFSFSNDAKLETIKLIDETIEPASTLGKYIKFSTRLGQCVTGLGMAATACQAWNYGRKGGTDWKVYGKYAIDAYVAFLTVTIGGPAIWIGAFIYFGLDLYTDGFGLNYSGKQQLNNQKNISDENN